MLYAYDTDAGEKHETASALVDRLWRDRLGAISVQILQESYVNVTRKAAAPLQPELEIERLTSLSRWRVHSPLSDDAIDPLPRILLGLGDRPQCRRITLWHIVDRRPVTGQ